MNQIKALKSALITYKENVKKEFISYQDALEN